MSSWPKASTRSASVLWRDLALAAEPARLAPLEDDHWLAALRHGNSVFLTSEGQTERFLLYDVELNYALPLKLAGGKNSGDSIGIANAGTAALHDVVLYCPERGGAGWRSATLADLPPGRQAEPASAPSTGPSTTPRTSAFATSPATLAMDPAGARDLRLIPTPTTQPADFLADHWNARLQQRGLDADDLALIARILQAHGLDAKRLTAVYRMDDAELDRLLPLEVLPQPKKIVRVALVIVRNADPAVPAEIDDLIVRLGDDDWRKREEASRLLSEFGPAARSQLQAALKNNDAEIVLRAERLLRKLEN